MICYEVYVNGKKRCIAGVGGLGALTGVLTWVKREPHEADEGHNDNLGYVEELRVHLGGLTHHGKDYVHLDWLNEDVRVGDEIRFRIVERETCDPPESARTDIAETVEQGRREYYEELKQEYEANEEEKPDV